LSSIHFVFSILFPRKDSVGRLSLES
jgi:hypothetical protein